ncbi:MAG TPA: site-specific DNA-methyltransferase, partial [Candidatus Methylacidiphilales bacterium]
QDSSLLPPGEVDVILGSPPYNVGMPYSGWDDLLPEDIYLRCLKNWLTSCFVWADPHHGRLLLVVPIDTHKKGPFPLAAHATRIAIEVGWRYRATVLWAEPSTKSWIVPSKRATDPDYHCSAESILIFYRGSWARPAPDTIDITPAEYADWCRGVWTVKAHSRSTSAYPAAFPDELVERLMRQFTFRGDRVLDPWAGGGTTLRVGKRLGRNCTGIDISA